MRKLVLLGLIILASVALSSCIYLSSISVSDLHPSAQTVFTSNAQGMGILHLTAPTTSELEDKVVGDLKSKGATKNIRVRLQMRDFFIVQMYEVIGHGEK